MTPKEPEVELQKVVEVIREGVMSYGWKSKYFEINTEYDSSICLSVVGFHYPTSVSRFFMPNAVFGFYFNLKEWQK